MIIRSLGVIHFTLGFLKSIPLTVFGELDVGDGLCVVRDDLDPLAGLDVPLHDVAVVVAGDQLLVQRAPHHRGDLGALGRDRQAHRGLVCQERKSETLRTRVKV